MSAVACESFTVSPSVALFTVEFIMFIKMLTKLQSTQATSINYLTAVRSVFITPVVCWRNDNSGQSVNYTN